MTDEIPPVIFLSLEDATAFGRKYGHPKIGFGPTVGEPHVTYLRADHALALVAEAYEVAAKTAKSCVHLTPDPDKAIRALTPADAQAAREARDAEVRREAAGIVRALAPTIEHDSTQDDRMHESILERAARHIERAVE